MMKWNRQRFENDDSGVGQTSDDNDFQFVPLSQIYNVEPQKSPTIRHIPHYISIDYQRQVLDITRKMKALDASRRSLEEQMRTNRQIEEQRRKQEQLDLQLQQQKLTGEAILDNSVDKKNFNKHSERQRSSNRRKYDFAFSKKKKDTTESNKENHHDTSAEARTKGVEELKRALFAYTNGATISEDRRQELENYANDLERKFHSKSKGWVDYRNMILEKTLEVEKERRLLGELRHDDVKKDGSRIQK